MLETLAAVVTLGIGLHLGRLWERRAAKRRTYRQLEQAWARYQTELQAIRSLK